MFVARGCGHGSVLFPSHLPVARGYLTLFLAFPLQAELRKLAWSGIPDHLRPLAWPLLLVRSDYILRVPV